MNNEKHKVEGKPINEEEEYKAIIKLSNKSKKRTRENIKGKIYLNDLSV